MNILKTLIFLSLFCLIASGMGCNRSNTTSPGCAKAQFYDKNLFSNLISSDSNGGFVQIKALDGSYYRCSAEFNFLDDKVQMATGRHCFVPLSVEAIALRVYQHGGYTDISIQPEDIEEFAPFRAAQADWYFRAYGEFANKAVNDALNPTQGNQLGQEQCKTAIDIRKKPGSNIRLACYSPDDIVVLTARLPKDRPALAVKPITKALDSIRPATRIMLQLAALRLRHHASIVKGCSISPDAVACEMLRLPESATETFAADFQRFVNHFTVPSEAAASNPSDIATEIERLTGLKNEIFRNRFEHAKGMTGGLAFAGNFDLSNFSDKRRGYGIFKFPDDLQKEIVINETHALILINHDPKNTPFFVGKQDSGSLLIHRDLGILGSLTRVGDEPVADKVNDSLELPPSEIPPPTEAVSAVNEMAANKIPPPGSGTVTTSSTLPVYPSANSPGTTTPSTPPPTQYYPPPDIPVSGGGYPQPVAPVGTGSVSPASGSATPVYPYSGDRMINDNEIKPGKRPDGC